MRAYDIYKADNILIPLGWTVTIFSGLVFFPLLGEWLETAMSEAMLFQMFPFIPLFIFLGSGAMLVLGYAIRRREKMVNAIIHTLTMAREVRVADLLNSAGYSRDEISEALKQINRRGFGYFIWDQENDSITDGRLQRSMVFVDSCSTCGHAIGESYPLQLSKVPNCPYCGSPLDIEDWNHHKQHILDRMDSEYTSETNSDEVTTHVVNKNFLCPSLCCYSSFSGLAPFSISGNITGEKLDETARPSTRGESV